MYEDKRTIQPSGLLSNAGKKRYTPKPINVSLPPRVKPAAGHVNYNKEKMAMDDARREQERKQAEAQANAGGKIICCRWYELGLMPKHIFEADQDYGRWLLKHDREFMIGYLTYAPYVVKRMHGKTWGSRLFIKAIGPLVNPWGLEMAYRMGAVPEGSRLGSFLMWLCNRLFRGLCKYRALKLRIKRFLNRLNPEFGL